MQRPSSQTAIQVKDLHKTFGDQTILNGIDLTVARGETVVLLGRSGTGKSVLLKLMVGLQQPDSGSILIDGQEITGLGWGGLSEIRKKIGFLFQQAALYDSLTVEENVVFPLARHTSMPVSERRDQARALLANVGMEGDLDKLPSQISGGMQKRVGLARALALNPEFLLFDEPTAGLDPITAGEIGKLILKLKRQRRVTSLVVTHDIQASKAFSDRVILMDKGNVVIEGTFRELQNSSDAFVAQFLASTKGDLCQESLG